MKARKELESLQLLRRHHCASCSMSALTIFFQPTKRAKGGEEMKVIVENKKQYLADVKEMIDATKRLNEITKAAADELERLNAAREKAKALSR